MDVSDLKGLAVEVKKRMDVQLDHVRREFSGVRTGRASVTILDAGRATLELANPAQRQMIDRVEVGHPTESRIRVAFEVLDTEARTTRLVEQGAELVAPPTETPWRSLNSRLDAPAGLQITLFEELGPATEGVPDAARE